HLLGVDPLLVLVLRLLVAGATLAEAFAAGAVAGPGGRGLALGRELLALEVVLVELVVEDERELARVVADPAARQPEVGGVDRLAAQLGQLRPDLLLVEEGGLGLPGGVD